MNFTATDAKNRPGQVLQEASTRPVSIEKADLPHSVVIGLDRDDALVLVSQRRVGSRPDAGERFYAQYKDWVDGQNRLVDTFGVLAEEFRPW